MQWQTTRAGAFGAILLLTMLAAALGSHTTATADTAGYALEFDGNNDLVLLPYTAHIFGTGWENTKTVELWVRPNSAGEPCTSAGNCDLIFGDQPRWWGISHGNLNGQDRLWIWNTDFSGSTGIDEIGIPYTVGEWVHISLVHTDGMLYAYQNGLAVSSKASATTMQPHTGALPELRLGGMIKDTTSWTFAGQIDEVRLWNYARSEAEVQADLYHELAGDESGLMAYYQMSDGAGLTLTDDSGHGWQGTLVDGYQNVPPDGSPPAWVDSTAFDLAPTFTPSATGDPSTATATPVTPSATPVTPTATDTSEPATETATTIPPSETPTPSATALPPSATATSLPATATTTPGLPTPTGTQAAPTGTPPSTTPLASPWPTVTLPSPGDNEATIQMYLPITFKFVSGLTTNR